MFRNKILSSPAWSREIYKDYDTATVWCQLWLLAGHDEPPECLPVVPADNWWSLWEVHQQVLQSGWRWLSSPRWLPSWIFKFLQGRHQQLPGQLQQKVWEAWWRWSSYRPGNPQQPPDKRASPRGGWSKTAHTDSNWKKLQHIFSEQIVKRNPMNHIIVPHIYALCFLASHDKY